MQLPLTAHPPLESRPQQLLTRRLLPLFIVAFSQGLVLWAPIEKVFLKSIGFDQAALSLMVACYASIIPLLDLCSGLLADLWSRKGVLILASIASMHNALLRGLSHNVPTYLVSAIFGVDVALVSGNYESILYDTLLEQTGQSQAFEKRLAQVKLLNSLALIIGSLIGGLVATVLSPRLAYFATIPLVAISLGALAALYGLANAAVLFGLLFGVVSKHLGIFHAGWMVVGVTLLASVLLVKVALSRGFKGPAAFDAPMSDGAA
jgi:MFS family permease